MRKRVLGAVLGALILIAACAPTTSSGLPSGPCATFPPPTVAVVEFGNTTGRYGITVIGAESAATARMITLLLGTGCYDVLEADQVRNVMARQGLQPTQAEAIGRATGALYVVTGAVTRATFRQPRMAAFGVRLGANEAEVEVDVRVTEVASGRVVVSMTGYGSAMVPQVSVHAIPAAGTISFEDRNLGPALADAATDALIDVVAEIRRTF